jgi:hypothetical protein
LHLRCLLRLAANAVLRHEHDAVVAAHIALKPQLPGSALQDDGWEEQLRAERIQKAGLRHELRPMAAGGDPRRAPADAVKLRGAEQHAHPALALPVRGHGWLRRVPAGPRRCSDASVGARRDAVLATVAAVVCVEDPNSVVAAEVQPGDGQLVRAPCPEGAVPDLPRMRTNDGEGRRLNGEGGVVATAELVEPRAPTDEVPSHPKAFHRPGARVRFAETLTPTLPASARQGAVVVVVHEHFVVWIHEGKR